ncbi:MAG: 30S ribosomal protein S6 [Anaerolineae bacterium]
MNEYELALVIQPGADEAKILALKERVAEFLAANGGEVVGVKDWGHRSLAYPIGKFAAGFYTIMRIRLPSKGVGELQRSLRYVEDILRFVVVRAEEVPQTA